MPIPKSLSASSLQTYEACPARWVAEYIVRAPDFSTSAADLGTVCHSALELYVANGHVASPDLDALKKYYDAAYHDLFEDESRKAEGWDMLAKWFARTVWAANRSVLSTEVKTNFPVKTSAGEIPFNYILDRCDRIDYPDGTFDIEIVDYKTISSPLSAADLKNKVQARCYGVAGQIAYPEARRVWVTFDLLRFDAVGTVFTLEENREAYRYIKAVAERMITDKEPVERINSTCKWCVRKQVCKSLTIHTSAGGVAGGLPIGEAVARRARVEGAMGGLKAVLGELDEIIMHHAETEDVFEFDTDEHVVKITAKSQRTVDPSRAAEIIGPDLMAKYGGFTLGAFDLLMKGSELTRQQKDQLNSLLGRKFGEPSVKVFDKNPLGD